MNKEKALEGIENLTQERLKRKYRDLQNIYSMESWSIIYESN